MYEITDKMMKKLQSQAWNKFLRAKATTKFDELNVIKRSKVLYEELEKLNKEVYKEIAKQAYAQHSNIDIPKVAFILAILGAYDEVTQYVYNHEVDRKRARFAESIIASGNSLQNYQRAFNLWIKQAEQYAITVEDKATIKAYKDNGVKKLRWVSEKDSKTCSVCKERDGKVYDIDSVPSKPHINCRCYLVPKGE